jgi:large subunit ribosomal protein L18
MTTNKEQLKRNKRALRHNRVRSVVSGTSERPRLAVFRSASHIYAQLIDDKSGTTLAAASSAEVKGQGKTTKTAKADLSTQVGTAIADKAKAKGIAAVVFDRGGYRYHGRVKALAEAARAAGLQF